MHEIWGHVRKPLRYREWISGPSSHNVWLDVPDLVGPSVIQPRDYQEPRYAADTPALCFSCGQEYRCDKLAQPGPLICPHCGQASTYERSRRLLNERYPGLGM